MVVVIRVGASDVGARSKYQSIFGLSWLVFSFYINNTLIYRGNATIMKHGLSEAAKEGEMKNK